MNTHYKWRFFRAGGFDQVRLATGADLAALPELDPKLWVALSCPTRGLEFDTATLDLIDSDKDGRIRVPEILAATTWACRCLATPDSLLESSASLPLTAINDATPEGKQIAASAKQILVNLGKPDATVITREDTADTAKIFARTKFNGDGIVPADAAADEVTGAVIDEIIACLGGVTDRSGKPGVNQAKVDQFFAEATAYSQWRKKAEDDPALLPLGDATASASEAVQALKTKVDDFFARCRLAAFDPRAVGAMNRREEAYLELAAQDLTVSAEEMSGFPLARVEAGEPLPLKDGINPAWDAAVARLEREVVQPILGEKDGLSASEWNEIVAKLAPYEAWLDRKVGASVEKLGVERVRTILEGDYRQTIEELIARDKALEPEANAIAAVDKLLLYSRDLYTLLTNFVNFSHFYSPNQTAIFQAGTLYLDQRSCDLCLAVSDAAKHASMAALAGSYLAYCDCTRPGNGEKMQIVAAFMDGDSDNLMVGRNGLFFDRKGRDWDATITKIVDNPISVRQAFWSPYKKFVRLLEEQVAKRAAAADTASTGKLTTAASALTSTDAAGPAQAKRFDVGTVAALGVGVGAIATVVGGFVAGFLSLSWWQMPLAIVGMLVLISVPSVVIAALKLSKRNLGPILDANGWAVNAKARINIPFGRSLTGTAVLPPGSHRELTDLYRRKRPGRTVLLVVILVAVLLMALWNFGIIGGSWICR